MDKIRSLINTHQQRSTDSIEDEPILLDEKNISTKKDWEDHKDDPVEREEVMKSIDEILFSGDIDPSFKLLQELPEKETDLIALEEKRRQMRLQHYFVGRKLTDELLNKKGEFNTELDRVIELEQDLQKTFAVTLDIRFSVKQAKLGLTDGAITLLGYYSQRQRLIALLNTLKTIKVLHKTDERLRELIDKEDFPGAIQLCRDCQHAAVTYRQYTCIQDLNSKLKDTAVLIEEKLDVVLSVMCINFDHERYSKITTAYLLLGKLQSAMDQLHMHFTSAIHSRTYETVYRYASNTSADQKIQYEDLCRFVPPDLYIECLSNILTTLWGIMTSYQKMLSYHYSDSSCADKLSQFDKNYVQQKLQLGLARIWQDVQHKVNPYLVSQDLSQFQFDDFIKVLDLVNRLIQVGEEFCGTPNIPCDLLREPLRAQSVQYFRRYHASRTEELYMFLNMELWELLPVKPTFTTIQLNEFRFMASKKNDKKKLSEKGDGYFSDKTTSPFMFADIGVMEESFFDFQEDSDSDVDEELKQDFVEDGATETDKGNKRKKMTSKVTFHNSSRDGPILTNTTLNVLRYLGKYMLMMDSLKPIAFDVLLSMSQLFEYYMYAVYMFFGSTNVESSNPRLAQILLKIQSSIILGEEPRPNGINIPAPQVSDLINLHDTQNLFGLKERLIATESLVFLASQFDLWKEYLDNQIPADKLNFLNQFYNQTLPLSRELREAVYSGVASKAMSYNAILQLMGNVKWEIRELMSEPNSYVYVMLQEMEAMQQKISVVSTFVPIPVEVYQMIWTLSISELCRVFLEGFGSARKCTHEGRAWMQLDFQQFIVQVVKFITIKPIPGKDVVENFIKAYYLTEGDLEQWLRENYMSYSSKQLNSIINCTTAQFSKMMQRSRLSGIVDELIKKS